eukprot:TRINITY_DN7445_c0_g3_i2.p1 TRINITY_DN7445_c0_g3~~TRINITY_DN7445_c0_g3_i2.p1  ORF type:complete len:282 (+),score=56.62 TRINITY_DN7445_c0_g3_i2:446-1291(+)
MSFDPPRNYSCENSLSVPAKSHNSALRRGVAIADEVNDKKIEQLNRNRLSARKNRERKKMYVRSLENKVKALTKELEEVKRKLRAYEFNMKLSCDFIQCKVNKPQFLFDPYLEEFIEGYKRVDTKRMKAAFVGLIEKDNKRMEMRIRTAQVTFKKMVEIMLPLTFRSLMWAAENSYNAFNIMELYDNFDYPWDKKEGESEFVVDKRDFDMQDRKTFYDTRESIVGYADKLRTSIGIMNSAMKNVTNEIKLLENFIMDNITQKISLKSLGALLDWVRQVSVC